jgi:hypothetical protein
MGKTRAPLPYDGIPSAPARERWIRFNGLHDFCENPQDPLIESVLSKKIRKEFLSVLETSLGNSHLNKYTLLMSADHSINATNPIDHS